MNGAQEAPAAGDNDGSGTAKLRLDRAKRTVCFTIRVRNIGDVPRRTSTAAARASRAASRSS